MQLVALEGQSTGADGTFADFDSPTINSAGAVAFAATYYNQRLLSGIFVSSAAGLKAVATSGQIAPGTNGQTFTSFPFAPSLNILGQAAFFAFTSSGAMGLWVTSLTGTPIGIALQGAPFVSSSGTRTISRNLNSVGAFAFRLDFTDGSSGLYVATPPTSA